MTKGVKQHDYPPPNRARCDFCGQTFGSLQAWNQRTCHRCAAAGAPDQSKPEYGKALLAWQTKHGTGRDPGKRAAALRRGASVVS
jgi:hypothetical protein